MKNLPATIGLMMVLFIAAFFILRDDHQVEAQTMPGLTTTWQDTIPPKPRPDTAKWPPQQHPKKDKKHDRDTLRRDTLGIR
ncbi:hypothetical protein [Chitinophaga sp. sic0106]|uniref:hypothetical protein n=1 Tax=Chitinophaga sp. sic0106 TaxID=2854785 RepID=UPI001C4837BE|nr:hypothetical protein [Chitinophaga sp. sic0106]MBV7530573.1 hypothetical protein [Chitinophaga sp. sic0106]